MTLIGLFLTDKLLDIDDDAGVSVVSFLLTSNTPDCQYLEPAIRIMSEIYKYK